MINIVLDTNIIISAALTPNGNPAKIIRLITKNKNMQIYYSFDILNEYTRVLSYERFNFAEEKKVYAVNIIKKHGILIQPAVSEISFPDESDRIFYDAEKTVDALSDNRKYTALSRRTAYINADSVFRNV